MPPLQGVPCHGWLMDQATDSSSCLDQPNPHSSNSLGNANEQQLQLVGRVRLWSLTSRTSSSCRQQAWLARAGLSMAGLGDIASA